MLVPTVLSRLHLYSTQLRAAQITIDLKSGDRAAVARVAGNLLDLAEAMESQAEALKRRFA